MRAIWYESQGEADEVLTLGEIEEPSPGEGEVAVYVKASGINPSDVKQRAGLRGPMTVAQKIPHADGAGVIKSVGPGVDPSRIGERVWMFNAGTEGRGGTCAEVCVIPTEFAVPLADEDDFETGAALGIPAITAHRGMFCAGPVTGKTVLVTGGAGAVGLQAIQLARWGGAKQVIATVSSPEKAKIAWDAGAHEVINYKTQDVVDAIGAASEGEGVHHIVEVELGGNLETSLAVLRDHGSIAYYGSEGNRNPSLDAYPMMFKNISIQSIFMYTLTPEQRALAVSDVSRALNEGRLRPRIDRVFEMEEVAEAHKRVEAGEKMGAVIVRP